MRALWNMLGSRKGPFTSAWRARYSLLALGVAIFGLILSASAWFAVSLRENQLAALELSSSASGHALNLQVGIGSYLRKASGLRALFDSSDHSVSRAQFEKFTKEVMNDTHAILGMSWVPRITRDQRISHEHAAAVDGMPGYRIKALAAEGMIPSPEKDEYFPVFYTAPTAPGSSVYGLDLNDGGMRQETLEHARDSDAIATSPLFTLQSGIGYRRGFFVALPVYEPGSPHDTLEERRRNLRGYVNAVFQTSVLVETILSTTRKPAGLDLYFYPADYGRDTSELLYFHGSRSRTAPVEPLQRGALRAGPHWIGKLDVGESRWTMIAVPIPGGPGTAVHSGAWIALALGLFFSAIVGAYIWTTGRHSLRLQISNTQLDRTIGTLNTVNTELSARKLEVDTALKNMVQGFIMFDAQERIVVYNERYIEMYGLSRDIVKPGCSLLELLEHRAAVGHLEVDPRLYRDQFISELAKGEVLHSVLDTKDGRQIAVANKPMPGGGWVCTHEDITERRRAQAEISHMALHDGLTGLANRDLFDQEIARCYQRLRGGQKFALLCLDLDQFKNINDTLGHRLGDRLLKEVGTRLRLCVRDSDTVARLGSNEFAIVQCGVPDRAETRSLIDKIVDVIGRPFDLDGHQVVVGVSIGIATAPTDATEGVELLKAADLALLRAKTEGRGTYRFFERAMDGCIQAQQALDRDLHKALLNDEFVVHYQPLVNLESEQIASFEALVRWNHPERGMIPPADFIPCAEVTGLIVPIGEWVLRQACKEAVGWPSAISVAVNLSPVQFRGLDLCQTVSDALARSGLSADRLELEITESMLLHDQASTLETVRQLRALGVRIAMDDFGTGHSSLSALRNLPFDKIKIDRCFVHELLSKHDSRAIIQAVVQLASSLGIKTTAEGVETPGELDYLKRVGCTEAQGYLLSKPVPAKDVWGLLKRLGMQAEASAA
jgi:diguanylate cyclase (GGDEF)-like protein/PAS domain S-box-containing protein